MRDFRYFTLIAGTRAGPLDVDAMRAFIWSGSLGDGLIMSTYDPVWRQVDDVAWPMPEGLSEQNIGARGTLIAMVAIGAALAAIAAFVVVQCSHIGVLYAAEEPS